jgi:lipopolysaccharide/colanic/teichoic acid biosynthesis glycosyltransferase
MKRCLDVVVSGMALVLVAPVYLVVAAAIWLDDPGPVIYRHQRVGRGFKTFYVLKFRTMAQTQTIKSELTFSGDPRVTRVGRFLRAAKLDELPQLLNVLRGEMSLVGPRPESPQFVAHYTPEQRLLLLVRPGITGPASIRFRNQEGLLVGPDFQRFYVEVLMPFKLALNLEYVRHHNLWIDLKLLAQTVLVVLWPPATPPLPVPAPPASPAGAQPVDLPGMPGLQEARARSE